MKLKESRPAITLLFLKSSEKTKRDKNAFQGDRGRLDFDIHLIQITENPDLSNLDINCASRKSHVLNKTFGTDSSNPSMFYMLGSSASRTQLITYARDVNHLKACASLKNVIRHYVK